MTRSTDLDLGMKSEVELLASMLVLASEPPPVIAEMKIRRFRRRLEHARELNNRLDFLCFEDAGLVSFFLAYFKKAEDKYINTAGATYETCVVAETVARADVFLQTVYALGLAEVTGKSMKKLDQDSAEALVENLWDLYIE